MARAVIGILDVAPRGKVVVLYAAAAAVGAGAAGEVVSWGLVLLRASAREGSGTRLDSVLDAPDEILQRAAADRGAVTGSPRPGNAVAA